VIDDQDVEVLYPGSDNSAWPCLDHPGNAAPAPSDRPVSRRQLRMSARKRRK